MKTDHRILGIHLNDRVHHALALQTVLTEYGDAIKTRLGLHDVSETVNAPSGIVLLETAGSPERADALLAALRAVDGLDVQEMRFAH